MIKDVDNSKVISDGAIESPVLGIIPPTSLSVAGELVFKVHIKYQESKDYFSWDNSSLLC